MKQIAVISGKGGTGKTTITAAFAALAKNKVMADCDVDAADLFLILDTKITEKHEFKASKLASIKKDKCTECGKCLEVCRFSAISDKFVIDPIACEGCGVCFHVCPVSAIGFKEKVSGHYLVSETRFGPMVYARLGIAEENSGKLVTLVRKQARAIAEQNDFDYILIDGPPGIGCPVIASLTGVDLALVVTEPTLSGIHDLERIVNLAGHFKIKTLVCINKADINPVNTEKIKQVCATKEIKVIGEITYDSMVNKAVRTAQTVIEYEPQSGISGEIKKIWNAIR